MSNTVPQLYREFYRGYNGISAAFIFTATLFFTLAATDCRAQGAEVGDPIYVVDMQKIIDNSVIGKAARNNIEEEMKKKKLSLEKTKMELDKMQADIEKQTALLSKDALDGKRAQYLKKQRDFERLYSDQRDELGRKNQDAMAKVVKQIDDTVTDLATKKNYNLVMEKDGRSVAYVNQKYDISDEVIAALNEKAVGLK